METELAETQTQIKTFGKKLENSSNSKCNRDTNSNNYVDNHKDDLKFMCLVLFLSSLEFAAYAQEKIIKLTNNAMI